MTATTAATILAFEPLTAVVTAGRRPVDLTSAMIAKLAANLDREQIPGHTAWSGSTQRGVPYLPSGVYPLDVRHVQWVLTTRSDIPADHLVRPTCGVASCVQEDHLALVRKNGRVNQQRHPEKPIAQVAPQYVGPYSVRTEQPSDLPTFEEMIAFLSQVGVGHLNFPGGTKVFVRGATIDAPDFGAAVAKAMREAR